MPSDAEVVEVLAEWFLGADWHKGTSANEISSEALAALRSAGYAVVKAGELGALVEAVVSLRNYSGRAPFSVRTKVNAALIPFTKDPTNAQ